MRETGHDVVERPVATGDFVQFIGWGSNVWSYVVDGHDGPDEGRTTQLVSHVRRDNKGVLHRDRLCRLDVVGRSIRNDPGSLMHGLDDNALCRTATREQILKRMMSGESLVLSLPGFKVVWNEAWLDEEIVGHVVPLTGNVRMRDGTIVPCTSERALVPPSPLR